MQRKNAGQHHLRVLLHVPRLDLQAHLQTPHVGGGELDVLGESAMSAAETMMRMMRTSNAKPNVFANWGTISTNVPTPLPYTLPTIRADRCQVYTIYMVPTERAKERTRIRL